MEEERAADGERVNEEGRERERDRKRKVAVAINLACSWSPGPLSAGVEPALLSYGLDARTIRTQHCLSPPKLAQLPWLKAYNASPGYPRPHCLILEPNE